MADVSVYVAAITGAAAVLGASIPAVATTLRAGRQEAAERERLTKEVLADRDSLLSHLQRPANATAEDAQDAAGDTLVNVREALRKALAADAGAPGEIDRAPADVRIDNPITDSETTYDTLLINVYALGLTQARRAFTVSTAFSVFGGIVLVAGVAFALFRADTGEQVAGAITTTLAGALTSGLSQLFRGQSAKALQHLETQTTDLRKDVRAQTSAAKALRLLGQVKDEDLKAHLQAALILQFTGAVLPDLGPRPRPRADLNGNSAPSQQPGAEATPVAQDKAT